jgi:hypothetical protein
MSIAKRIAEKQNRQRRTISVPEWGEDGTPLLIYVSDVTAGDLDKLQRKHKDFINNMTIAGMVDLLILKAEDADGNRMFSLEDKFTLMGEPVNLIGDIAGKMFSDIASVEDQEKN